MLVTTLTKRMAEDLADYLQELGIRVHYLHSEVQTLERIEILRDLRLGVYDVVVGINLLREGLDLPEVSLVAILDADKEGFLRSEQSLIQTIGRAARHVNGTAIMYADSMTDSMRRAIDETDRRRKKQESYNVRTASCRCRSSRRCATSRSGLAVDAGGGRSRARSTIPSPATPAEGRGHAADQGPGKADEGGRAGPRVREGCGPARPDHRAAARCCRSRITGRSGNSCATC